MGAPNDDRSYDFIVIGGGSAGYAAARTAAEHGMRAAVVDGADTLGGLCILRGCMPSKTLIESANRYRSLRRAEEFGLRVDGHRVVASEIVARKRRLVAEFAEYRQEQLGDGRFDLVRGSASFVAPGELRVAPLASGSGERGPEFTLRYRSALVATGSEVHRLELPGLEEAGYWTSDEVLEAESIPDRLVVLGGGAIALELACYLEGLGKDVTVVQRSGQVLSGSDPDVARALEEAMSSRPNLRVFTGTRLTGVESGEGGVKTVRFEQGGEEHRVDCEQIVQALGRKPRIDGLGLDRAGIELDESGRVRCDPTQATSTPLHYAAGDVCGPLEVVHLAVEQGETAALNAAVELGFADGPRRKMDYRLKLYGIFTDPQVATVGFSESEARSLDRDVRVASHPFEDHGKSMVMGETHGFVKMIADARSGEILGAAVVGPEAVDLIHEVVVAMHFRSTAGEFLKIPHYHPTLSEIWTYPAEELA